MISDPSQEETLGQSNMQTYQVVSIASLIGLAPLLWQQFEQLWTKPHLQFFPMAIGAVAYLTYPHLLTGTKGSISRIVPWWIGGTIFMGLVGIWFFSPWMCQVAAVMLFAGWAMACTSLSWDRVVTLVIGLAITIPLPLNLDVTAIRKLQQISSAGCSRMLDGLGIQSLREGNVISIPYHRLFVEEACSGVDSLYSLLAIAIFLAIYQKRSWLHGILFLITVPLWSMLGNLLRLFFIATSLYFFEIDLSEGMPHTILGLLLFVVSCGCLLATDNLLNGLLASISNTDSRIASKINAMVTWPSLTDSHAMASAGSIAPSKFLLGMAIMLGLAGTVPAYILFSPQQSAKTAQWSEADAELFPGKNGLDFLKGKLHVLDFTPIHRNPGSMYGEYSRSWRVRFQDRELTISIDFPFPGWHPLDQCYQGAGWTINSIEKLGDESSWPWVEASLHETARGYGHNWLCFIDEYGNPYAPQDEAIFWNDVTDVLQARRFRNILDYLKKPEDAVVITTVQLQIFLERSYPITDDDKQLIRELMLELRQGLQPAIAPAIRKLRGH